jgi:hypothetical protein
MTTRWTTLNKTAPVEMYWVLIIDIEWYKSEWKQISQWFDENALESKPDVNQYLIKFINKERWTSWSITWD